MSATETRPVIEVSGLKKQYKLGQLGGDLLVKMLPSIVDGAAPWTVQDESLVTHAAKISKAEMRLDPAASACDNVRRVLASSDAAPARCVVAGKAARIVSAQEALASSSISNLDAGAFAIHDKRLYMGCSDGIIEILELKPDGKRAMDAASWAAGQREREGSWETLS